MQRKKVMNKLIHLYRARIFNLCFYFTIPISIIVIINYNKLVSNNIQAVEIIEMTLPQLFVIYLLGAFFMLIFSVYRQIGESNINPFSSKAITNLSDRKVIPKLVESNSLSFDSYKEFVFYTWILYLVNLIIY